MAGRRFSIPMDGALLLHGSDRVQQATCVEEWPGIKPCGEITDYQLMLSAQQSRKGVGVRPVMSKVDS
eukprot:3347537-Amphidinium_carterae.1